ncbi:hypothetical protein VNO77_39396 [Canavalia gladiata]|uniref:Uncharacterized protein n=1 Tax=Canavalia gladiata TaxID=3824 RepID=A0AAN9KCH7_CANGL
MSVIGVALHSVSTLAQAIGLMELFVSKRSRLRDIVGALIRMYSKVKASSHCMIHPAILFWMLLWWYEPEQSACDEPDHGLMDKSSMQCCCAVISCTDPSSNSAAVVTLED